MSVGMWIALSNYSANKINTQYSISNFHFVVSLIEIEMSLCMKNYILRLTYSMYILRDYRVEYPHLETNKQAALYSNETSRNESSCSRYLPLFWPVRQSGATVEHNLSLSQNTPISYMQGGEYQERFRQLVSA